MNNFNQKAHVLIYKKRVTILLLTCLFTAMIQL